MLKRFLLAWCLALSPVAGAATIVVYGDSLSSAYGLPRERGWVSLLEKRLHEKNLNYTVANLSISGETTLGGKNRIEAALKTHQPDIVILALGANDGLRGQSLDAMRANLETMINACRRTKAQVLLVGMRLPPNYGPVYAEKFHQVFASVARERRVPLVPFLLDGFAEKRAYFQADGIHPTAEAQPLMLDAVWKGLRPLLKKP